MNNSTTTPQPGFVKTLQKGWIAVDLDGTLAEYHGWQGHFHVGQPIPPMANRVREWIAAGEDVRIFTARVGPQVPEEERPNVLDITRHIQDWTEQHLGVRLPVTHTKDFAMRELWDDRAVQVIHNTGLRADQCRDLTGLAPDQRVQRVATLVAELMVATGLETEEIPIVLAGLARGLSMQTGLRLDIILSMVRHAAMTVTSPSDN